MSFLDFMTQPLVSASTMIPIVGSATWYLASLYFKKKIKLLEEKSQHLDDQCQQQKQINANLQKSLEAQTAEEQRQKSLHILQIQHHETTLAERDSSLKKLDAKYQQAKQKLTAYYSAYKKLTTDYEQLEARYNHTKKELAEKIEKVEQLTAKLGDLDKDTLVMKNELVALNSRLQQLDAKLRRALKLQGQLWNSKALKNTPRFREIAVRQQAIVAVMNLKGGVGKTTVTAHLAMALAREGKRVLIIDLDLQGSLTSFILPYMAIRDLREKKSLIQHYLMKASLERQVRLSQYTANIFNFSEHSGRLDIIGSTDDLAYAELSLSLRWLTRPGEVDSRFLLRKGLHRPDFYKEYDIVLLDCPPFVNVSCINALAACDYVLVPAMPSRKSLERIPILARKYLKDAHFLNYINARIKVLGFIANRTWGDTLTKKEQEEFDIWISQFNESFGAQVRRFDTIIPQLTEFQDNEKAMSFDSSNSSSILPAEDSRIARVFKALALEVLGALPHAS